MRRWTPLSTSIFKATPVPLWPQVRSSNRSLLSNRLDSGNEIGNTVVFFDDVRFTFHVSEKRGRRVGGYYRQAKLRSPCGPFVSCGGRSRGAAARRAEVW